MNKPYVKSIEKVYFTTEGFNRAFAYYKSQAGKRWVRFDVTVNTDAIVPHYVIKLER